MSRSYSTVIRRIGDTNQGAGASAPAPQAGEHKSLAARIPSREARPTQQRLAFPAAAILLLSATSAGFAADASLKDSGDAAAPCAWNGFYAGGHIGYAWGTSNYTISPTPGEAPGSASGSLDFSQGFNSWNEGGSWFEGLQAGYNYTLPNRVVLGVEADGSFPAYQNLSGVSIGSVTNFASPSFGAGSYSDTLIASGTARARIGYAPGNWLFYVTGGFAWTFDQVTLNQVDPKYQWRTGWTAGAGVEFPISGHWTGKVEYLYSDYGASGPTNPIFGERLNSDLSLQEVRVGVNYQLGNSVLGDDAKAPAVPAWDGISFHGQFTAVEQAYPGFYSPFPDGPNSLPKGGMGRETTDLTLYLGLKLWQGAEFWVNPEIDQGFGVGNTHGLAGFPSAESYKLGWDWPYARLNRYFVRQTIDLGGATQKVDADQNVFEGSTTADRLVITVGKFQVVDLFDTNKYANSPKVDFLNWTSVNTGSFDYAGDAWAYTYGAAAEWYKGNYTLRGGIFDMSQTPSAGGFYGAPGYGLDPSFSQVELIGELEERHELWGQPGKLKLTGYVIDGRMGDYNDALALQAKNPAFVLPPEADTAADYWINATRKYRYSPGVNFNMEQGVTDAVGIFARAGWCDGNYELWDNTDVDASVQLGVSVKGTGWGRPDDTFGIDGVINEISNPHAAWLNAGGIGIVIGDGQGNLPNPGLEKIIEAYYSYAVSSSVKLSFDYQFIDNPAYNTDKGPVNLFAGRFHWTF
jgi:high affinity Mn2+ porin